MPGWHGALIIFSATLSEKQFVLMIRIGQNNTWVPTGFTMRLERFDLNLLVVLDALLEERNVTKASQRVHFANKSVQQSGINYTILKTSF